MRKSKLVAKAELQIPAGIRDLFDDPPLLASENPQSYVSLLIALADDVKPAGVIEWLWLKDIVLQTWEIQRLWVFKSHIIELERDELFIETIDPETKRHLGSAQGFRASIDVLEKLDRQIASLERRRDNTLREIEVRREILARRVREASAKLIENKGSRALVAAE